MSERDPVSGEDSVPQWLFPDGVGLPGHQLVAETLAPIAVLDGRLRHLYVNPAWVEVGGVPAAAFLGRTLGEALPGLRSPDDVLLEVLADGRPREATITGTTEIASPLGQRLWRAVYHRVELPGQGAGLCGIGVEISNLRRYLDDLETAHQRLAMLDASTTRIGTTLDIGTTCQELADFLTPSLADTAAVGLVEEQFTGAPPPLPGFLRLRKMKGAALPGLEWLLRQLGGPGPYVDLPRGSAPRRCMDSGRPWLGNQASDELFQKVTVDPERAKIFRTAGIHSLLIAPLITAGRAVGVVLLGRAGASPPFDGDDVETVQALAARAAVSVDSARRYSYEHTMALELQRALLSEPSTPHPTVEVAARYLPSGRSVLVGGDWYDAIPLPDSRTLLVMGDVMGHGFQAAVAMSQYRSLLRTIAVSGVSVDKILGEFDRRVAHIGLDRLATCLLAVMDSREGTCTVASAGHLPPAVVRPDGSTEVLWLPAGPPIGTGLGGYESSTVRVEHGTALLLYTDGLVERRDTDIDVSVQGLAALSLPAGGTLDDMLDTLLAHLADGAYEDDVAILAARPR
ncbi:MULTISPECIES: SpoIIE family protein phosphatase [Streptomyces]|uniref:SpoIIE family protein phosphatase n=1 Tax=Streptomyces griseiscabiei TaxID=2993540 RepID=A0ABU4L4M5_9ACTN|nr:MULTISPECIES: SpoIIE family protein phosphatase [Streptomyces]MBZ3901160.1 SpoIIE family protein phosphatase [Streptomyces griseiscabiei]MDX2910290.1 SpoIIE family protein phosphatase [Streptomyces griseiscabiei]